MIESQQYTSSITAGTDANLRNMLDHTLEHFRAIVQSSDDAIISKTLDGIVTSWNSGAQSIFGYTEHEMLGKPMLILIPPERIDEESYFLKKMMAGERIDHFETERLHKNGNRINVSVTLSPIHDRAGKIIGASKIARDITQQLKLQASNQIANAIFESSDDAIYSKALNGTVTSWNPGASRMFGYSADEILGRTLDGLFPIGRESEETYMLERIANGQRIDHFETERICKDGSRIYLSVSVSPLRDAWGKIIGSSRIARDITERKLSEDLLRDLNKELGDRVIQRTRDLAETNAALQKINLELKRTQDELIRREKLAALGVLIAGVSHEMNTPLGNSLTVGSTLHDELTSFEEEVETGKISKYRLKEFNQNLHVGLDLLLRNLARAIDQIVHFRQVSVDQASERRRTFELRAIVDDNVSVLQPQFTHTPHKVVVDVPNGIVMDSYPGAIGQIIANLAMNALVHGFSKDMEGVVLISAKLQGLSHVQITCTDNGTGIPNENLNRIFDPFFTTRMGQGGSGLGLNIVSNIVTLTLGGSIHVESEIGGNTTFTVIIPLITS
jgi:PAS domain S-box-containing protein